MKSSRITGAAGRNGSISAVAPAPVLAELPLERIIQELVARLNAKDAGVVAVRDGGTLALQQHPAGAVWPWRQHPELLTRVCLASTSVRHDEGDSWLLAPIWLPRLSEPWVLWTRRAAPWTDAEAAALAAEADALPRRLAELCPVEIEAARASTLMDHAAWLAGRLAHDFGNFLTGILGFTELALAQVTADSTPHRYLKEVWQSSRQGAQWVHQLQMFGRRMAVNQVPCTVALAVGQHQVEAGTTWRNGVSLKVELPADLPLAAIEADALGNVLGELLSNAHEATLGQGTVTLSARTVELTEPQCLRWLGRPRPGPALEIAVADAGPGLKPEARGRLFRELFFSSKPRHRGLGLAVAYGIVQAYQGGLRLDDNMPRGTVARVVLPTAGTTDDRAEDASQAPHRAHILVVDDDATIVETVCTNLVAAGHHAQGATDPHEALEAYGPGERFDLVISDVRMPGLSGFELARRVQQCNPQARFLFISSQASLSGDPLLHRFELVAKPFEAETLLQAVGRALKRERRP
jgi:signal transduction histidine kinase/CheY-like chemotaxis protein